MKTTIQEQTLAAQSPAEQEVRWTFATPITSIIEAKAFILALNRVNLMFHLEDDPATVIRHCDDTSFFSDTESALLRLRVAELYSFDWTTEGTECPIGFYLDNCVN